MTMPTINDAAKSFPKPIHQDVHCPPQKTQYINMVQYTFNVNLGQSALKILPPRFCHIPGFSQKNAMQGLNTGVLLLDLERMRNSSEFNHFTTQVLQINQFTTQVFLALGQIKSSISSSPRCYRISTPQKIIDLACFESFFVFVEHLL